MAKISVSAAIKKNLGNYEMFDVHASIEKEVPDGLEENTQIWNTLWEIVDAQLEARLIEVDEAIGGKK